MFESAASDIRSGPLFGSALNAGASRIPLVPDFIKNQSYVRMRPTGGLVMRRVLFIFGDLSDGDIEWLAAAGERKTFPKGSVLVEQGKPIAEIYILLEGQLSVAVASPSKSVTINTLQKGEIVGELSFLDSRPPSATVSAAVDSSVLAISRDKLSA